MLGFWPGREVRFQHGLNRARRSWSVAVTASTMPRVTTWPPWMAAWTFPRSRIFSSVAAAVFVILSRASTSLRTCIESPDGLGQELAAIARVLDYGLRENEKVVQSAGRTCSRQISWRAHVSRAVTQKPTTDAMDSAFSANLPSRVCFKVASNLVSSMVS